LEVKLTENSLSAEQLARQAALGVLSHADPARLAQLWEDWADKPAVTRVRGPETGLVMVRGRAGGGGNPFNLGEATVTRATIRLQTGEVGHAWCLGRDTDKALIAACFDALFQRDSATVEQRVLAPLRAELAEADAVRAEETASTKVDFFTMVRGED
jgi:alpha-D-ribose 1-methylphosphonate 5-triphosphate synthase subunit PhnG